LDPTVDDDNELAIALADFQAQHGLPVSTVLDDTTRLMLQQGHGSF
jgi:hypothetical protein